MRDAHGEREDARGGAVDTSAPEIQAELAATHRWLARYNAALDMAPAERRKLLVERFAAVGGSTVPIIANDRDPHQLASRPRCANTSWRSSTKCESPRWRG